MLKIEYDSIKYFYYDDYYGCFYNVPSLSDHSPSLKEKENLIVLTFKTM